MKPVTSNEFQHSNPHSQLNPNHGVTRELHDQWYKLCAALMLKFGVDTVDITSADIERLATCGKANITMRPHGNVITLALVTDAEVLRLARKEGGLPV